MTEREPKIEKTIKQIRQEFNKAFHPYERVLEAVEAIRKEAEAKGTSPKPASPPTDSPV